MKYRELVKILKTRGYHPVRQNGTSHLIFTNGVRSFPLAVRNEVNKMISRRILKETEIK